MQFGLWFCWRVFICDILLEWFTMSPNNLWEIRKQRFHLIYLGATKNKLQFQIYFLKNLFKTNNFHHDEQNNKNNYHEWVIFPNSHFPSQFIGTMSSHIFYWRIILQELRITFSSQITNNQKNRKYWIFWTFVKIRTNSAKAPTAKHLAFLPPSP